MPRRRVITADPIIAAFRPLYPTLNGLIASARKQTTLDRYRTLGTGVTRESGLKRLAGQARWMLVADGLVLALPQIDGFGVASTDAQHNGGQYVFEFPGGLFTVKQEPHDSGKPDDGRYIQDALAGIQEQADLAASVDADALVVVYLAVTQRRATLKVCHPTLKKPLEIAVSQLAPAPTPMPAPPKDGRRRTRARSTRRTTRHDGKGIESSDS